MYLGPMPGGGESGCGAHAAPRQHGCPCTSGDASVGPQWTGHVQAAGARAGSCCTGLRRLCASHGAIHLLQELRQLHSMTTSRQNHAKPP